MVCFSLTMKLSKEWKRHKGIGEGFADRSILMFSLSTHLCCRDPDWLQSLALCPVFWQETFICPTSHSWRWIPTTCIWWQCSLKQLWMCASTPAVVTLLFTKILWELGENWGCTEAGKGSQVASRMCPTGYRINWRQDKDSSTPSCAAEAWGCASLCTGHGFCLLN